MIWPLWCSLECWLLDYFYSYITNFIIQPNKTHYCRSDEAVFRDLSHDVFTYFCPLDGAELEAIQASWCMSYSVCTNSIKSSYISHISINTDWHCRLKRSLAWFDWSLFEKHDRSQQLYMCNSQWDQLARWSGKFQVTQDCSSVLCVDMCMCVQICLNMLPTVHSQIVPAL